MSINAFGVEDSRVSKGLPSALRSTLKSSLDSGEYTKNQRFMLYRAKAHEAGRAGKIEEGQLTRKISQEALAQRMPKTPTPSTGQLIRRHRLRLHREGQNPRPQGLGKIPRSAFVKGKGNVRITDYLGKDHFIAVTNRDEKIIRPRDQYKFGKRRPSQARLKAVAQQDADLAALTQEVAAHHAQNRMPKSLTQKQYATIKSRKKVYGYHIKHGWGIHDKTEAVYPAREFYNTSVAPGKDVRRQNQKPIKIKAVAETS